MASTSFYHTRVLRYFEFAGAKSFYEVIRQTRRALHGLAAQVGILDAYLNVLEHSRY
jgi:hypothetical protein